MYHLKTEEMHKIAPLFEGWNETMIWSCLQGYMGNAWVDSLVSPQSAQIITGDFCFFSGKPNMELVKNIPTSFPSPCLLMAATTEQWFPLIEQQYAQRAEKSIRYAFKKDTQGFDTVQLQRYANNLPSHYSLLPIDEKQYHVTSLEPWSRDLCSQFPTYEDYEKRGLGFVIMEGEKIICGASSYTVYRDGIEIEIDTHPEYRRRGLATVCAANLILKCLEQRLYPSWDAANKESASLAQKLGYISDGEYTVYAVKTAHI
ncbi:GNAT family N-acetyltransferase [Oscillospiraceae bacterium MB08-C2-2]|nr:GNAT family N-acetyltransferase [Oscillospiraceae bacterium MB08-C2-2]